VRGPTRGPAREPGRGAGPGRSGAAGRSEAPGAASRSEPPGAAGRSEAPFDIAGGVLVIGYGNSLRTDDGVGVHAAALLAADPRLAGAEVLALHQLAPELAEDMSQASLVVFVDASTEGPPGSVAVRRRAGAVPGATTAPGASGMPGATSHHVGADELLALARELYGAAPDAFVVSVGVADMEAGEALSPAVAGALPAVTQAIVDLITAHRRPPPAGE